MKNLLLLCLTIVLFIVLACSSWKIQKGKKDSSTTLSPTDSANYKLIISFFSRGEGTDRIYSPKFNEFLSDFQSMRKNPLKVEKFAWGREGEVDYCFKLTELFPKEQQQFIEDVKTLLKESKLVHIEENVPCRHKR